jgi:molybdate transport system ATP-binding protein
VNGLDAHVGRTIGALDLDASIEARPGELLAVVGPNGAGKTTLLRCLAGLEALDHGYIRLDGVYLDDPATNTFVRPAGRRTGVVFQDPLLFAHLSATENVAFGLRARGTPRVEARRTARAWLTRVGLDAHVDAKPAQLSGGQAQRVALARALAADPLLLLLDEPLAALDAATRVDVRRALREHLAGFRGPQVLVTHDPLDALTLADRIVVLDAGRVVQDGSPDDVRRHPRSPYVARLLGVNLLRGTRSGASFSGDGVTLTVPAAGEGIGAGPCIAVVSPRAVGVSLERPAGSARNVWPAVVMELDREPERVRVRVDTPAGFVADVTHESAADLALAPGVSVWCALKATAIELHDA